MSGERQGAERDAVGIIYIDAPLPTTVLAQAYRMNSEWDRLHRPIPPGSDEVAR